MILPNKELRGFDKNIPIVGKEYNCFDDGKIRPSRHYTVKVTALLDPRKDKIPEDLKNLWESEVKACHWLYKAETDYFAMTMTGDNEQEVFVRTNRNEWFSLSTFLGGGLLDINNEMLQASKEYYDYSSIDLA